MHPSKRMATDVLHAARYYVRVRAGCRTVYFERPRQSSCQSRVADGSHGALKDMPDGWRAGSVSTEHVHRRWSPRVPPNLSLLGWRGSGALRT